MKSQTTKIYSQLDEDDIKLIAALLRELGYGAEGELKSVKILPDIRNARGGAGITVEESMKIEIEWEHEAKDNA